LYSYSFLINLERLPSKNNSFLVFAPQTFDQNYVAPLANSRFEIERLKEYYNGRTFYTSEATKEHFLENLQGSSIIHLASHADAQDKSTPWNAFYVKNNLGRTLLHPK